MHDEYSFSPEEVTIENLDELSKRECAASEARMYELADIADAAAEFLLPLLADEIGAPELLSLIAEGLAFGSYPSYPGKAAFSERAADDVRAMLSLMDRARLTELLLDRLKAGGHPLTEADFLGESEGGRIYGYVKNQFSDEAFDVLTESVPDAGVRYYKSFSDCAAALARDEVDHILLPLEERGGVRLPTVSELIYRYDFRINSVTPVFGYAADADIKYAEISRRFIPASRMEGDDRYLELRIPAQDGAALSEAISVATAFGMSAYRVNTHTYDIEGERSSYFSLVLREGRDDFAPFLTYLALFAADFVPVGVYKNLE